MVDSHELGDLFELGDWFVCRFILGNCDGFDLLFRVVVTSGNGIRSSKARWKSESWNVQEIGITYPAPRMAI
ncbi:hypothetical protein I7I53_11617 [Histoplasma capsulatum var. duboisii H88]|uniref:Uncharacterized protein n=1 Tax=Ajellomyces capsulatus (strain H88) TaxID=544711 RepID=A0A8A1LW39_AJEC8|nr:hypothetical protein I7I53_11617 [Histoplasma capsulatum var. duboisii H88]